MSNLSKAMVLAATFGCAWGANAATISVTSFDAASYNSAFNTSGNSGEDFETLGSTLGEGEVGPNLFDISRDV